MTGILPIKNYEVESSLSGTFEEFTMTSPGFWSKYIGFTKKEVKKLCIDNLPKYQIDANSNKIKNFKSDKDKELIFNYEKIKKWYKGYRLLNSRNYKKYEIYTPYSIIRCLFNKLIKNYWNRSETCSNLSKFINLDFSGIKNGIAILINNRKNGIKINIEKCQYDMNNFSSKYDVLTHLVHLGYLAYEEEKKIVYIPNEEVRKEFENSTNDKKDWNNLIHSINESKILLEVTWRFEENKVAEIIEKAHNTYSSNKNDNDENALSYTVQLAYSYAKIYYTIIQ